MFWTFIVMVQLFVDVLFFVILMYVVRILTVTRTDVAALDRRVRGEYPQWQAIIRGRGSRTDTMIFAASDEGDALRQLLAKGIEPSKIVSLKKEN